MGEVRIDVELTNEWDALRLKNGQLPAEEVRKTTVSALVNTGAVMLLMPQDLIDTLGIDRTDRAIVTLANDERIELDVAGPIEVVAAGRRWVTDCLVGPPQCERLVGQLLLERLDLIVDPLKQTVHPRPESPYLPSLKMK